MSALCSVVVQLVDAAAAQGMADPLLLRMTHAPAHSDSPFQLSEHVKLTLCTRADCTVEILEVTGQASKEAAYMVTAGVFVACFCVSTFVRNRMLGTQMSLFGGRAQQPPQAAATAAASSKEGAAKAAANPKKKKSKKAD